MSKLPPLPEPISFGSWTSCVKCSEYPAPIFSADQMQAYAHAAIEANQVPTAQPAEPKPFVIEDFGMPLEKSEWPAILEKISGMEPISTGQGTHCCDETFFLEGCSVSVVYDYSDQSEPIEIRRYKPVEKTKNTP